METTITNGETTIPVAEATIVAAPRATPAATGYKPPVPANAPLPPFAGTRQFPNQNQRTFPPRGPSLITAYQADVNCPQIIVLWSESVDPNDAEASGFVVTIHRKGQQLDGDNSDNRRGLRRLSVKSAYNFIRDTHDRALEFPIRFTEMFGVGPNQARAEVYVGADGKVRVLTNSAVAVYDIRANGLSRRPTTPIQDTGTSFEDLVNGGGEVAMVAASVVAASDDVIDPTDEL